MPRAAHAHATADKWPGRNLAAAVAGRPGGRLPTVRTRLHARADQPLLGDLTSDHRRSNRMSVHGSQAAVDLTFPARGHAVLAGPDMEPAAHPVTMQQEEVKVFLAQPHDAGAVRLVEGVHLPAAGGVNAADQLVHERPLVAHADVDLVGDPAPSWQQVIGVGARDPHRDVAFVVQDGSRAAPAPDDGRQRLHVLHRRDGHRDRSLASLASPCGSGSARLALSGREE